MSAPDPKVVALLTISWPGQCCPGYCIEGIGLHAVTNEQAEVIARVLPQVLADAGIGDVGDMAQAWDEGFQADYEGDGWPPNPYRARTAGDDR